MDPCVHPVAVKFPDYVKEIDFIRGNLDPVVVLTDFRKQLRKESVDSEKKQARKVSDGVDTPKKKFFAFEKDLPFSLKQPSHQKFKSVKRKRESWDPSVEYEVEKIVGSYLDKKKKMWYFVKWKNWSSHHNTFEPIENLTRCHYELMRYFEHNPPDAREIRKKNVEIIEALRKRDIYNKLINNKCRAEDFAEFPCEHSYVSQIFESKNLDVIENEVRNEYKYIVRSLIGMYLHEDPGLMLRGQNFKLILLLIQFRRKQLERNGAIEKTINAREKTKIFIENKVDLEEFPDINYIVDLKYGNDGVVLNNPLLGCECPDGCSYRSLCCGKLADSVFAYNTAGKLRISKRLAIYECNSRCRCSSSCPNRVVQRGRQVELCIFKTKSCGWGVKALEKIPRGSFVCEYVGELIPDLEAVARDGTYLKENKSGYLFDLDFFTDPNLDMYCIDATKQGNVARFINHSCDPNLVVYPVWIDGLAPNIHRLAFFAKRNIHKGEEIQFDYENLDYEKFSEKEKSHGLRMVSNVRCQCKAANCRKWVFGNQ